MPEMSICSEGILPLEWNDFAVKKEVGGGWWLVVDTGKYILGIQGGRAGVRHFLSRKQGSV